MRHHVLAAAFFCTAILLNGTALAGPPLQDIPLKWTPTSSLGEMGALDLSGALLTTRIRVDTFTDTRENPSLIAENREKADKIRQVTTSSDVAAFVADHLKETARSAGLNIVDGDADVRISGEIHRFFVTELNTYNGEISLLVHVKDSAGKELWTGAVNGGASHFGRSYSAANYFETTSDMVLRATYNLLANAAFREAVAKH
jgi:hypothetical protein